ncbi:MAG: hypothetical protein K1X72_17380 [Pyrinomonadaceae bacterium]|nr:hypothetical protein [Pyrinomonadaceae bacterium]
MKKLKMKIISKRFQSEKGTTTIIALLIMMLLMGFMAFALTRSANETVAVSNEISETRTLYAAQASIENMALKADAVFENKLTLTTSDVTAIASSTPSNYSDYTFEQSLTKTKDAEVIDATGEQFQGLKAIRDEWQLITTATDTKTGVKVTLRRRFFDNRIPIFQFGTFYDGDMNFFRPAPFNFGGRVHSNANIFIQSAAGLNFASKVTAVGQILTDVAPNGSVLDSSYSQNFIKDGSGTYKQLNYNEGSAISTVSGSNLLSSYPARPAAYRNPNWATIKARFNNNLLNEQKKLNLPLKPEYINLIKRGKNIGDKFKDSTGTLTTVTSTNKDGLIPLKERFYNKSGIRISLADSQDKLPGCASASGTCGVQLDNGNGYLPVAMNGGQQSTRFNAARFKVPGKQIWIKIEAIKNNGDLAPTATDITADILSLGLTERPPASLVNNTTPANSSFLLDTTTYQANSDKYAIVKLQRFLIPGSVISSSKTYLNTFTASSVNYNYVLAQEKSPAPSPASTPNKNPIDTYITENQAAIGITQDRYGCHGTQKSTPTSSCSGVDNTANQITATVSAVTGRKVAPFPIMMFDTREGLPYDSIPGSGTPNPNPVPSYPSGRIPWSGVMSIVDIDMANLELFLEGNSTVLGLLPKAGTTFSDSFTPKRALSNTDIPNANGWVLYISDRRSDYDYDGEYDMEDLLPNGTTSASLNDGTKTAGEDSNNNGVFENDYINEAPKYSEYVSADVAATSNTRFFRRGVRLINGTTLPGGYDSATPSNTKGLTVASENGVYVLGNYNSTGVTSSTSTPTPAANYQPQGAADVPAAVIADSITLLSNSWQDSYSFSSPFDRAGRTPSKTTYRFAALVGNSKDFAPCPSNQSQGSDRYFDCQSGGVHNLLRYLENWNSTVKSNYSGSLINLYNAANSNSVFKCCRTVYEPPVRNYVFDETFLDINRIPPGSPFLQNLTLTGFERIND